MAISTINQAGLNAPLTLTSPTLSGTTTATTVTSPSATALTLQSAGTTAVTIDTSQNVGIGTSSPASRLDVQTAAATNGGVTLGVAGTTYGTVGSGGFSVNGGAITDFGVRAINNLLFSTGSGAPERMRIDSSGNVGIGTSSPGAKLEVSDNSGNPTIVVRTQNAGSFPIEALQTSASCIGAGVRSRVTNKAPGTDYQAFTYYNDNAGAYRFLVQGNGNVQNTNNSYGAISDIKLKENIVDATPKLEDLCKVKVRNYNLIGDNTKQIGVVAQELEEVFAGLIEETQDRDVDGNDLGTTTKQVKYSVFVPMLIKAIQELNAKVDAQAAEIATLKAGK